MRRAASAAGANDGARSLARARTPPRALLGRAPSRARTRRREATYERARRPPDAARAISSRSAELAGRMRLSGASLPEPPAPRAPTSKAGREPTAGSAPAPPGGAAAPSAPFGAGSPALATGRYRPAGTLHLARGTAMTAVSGGRKEGLGNSVPRQPSGEIWKGRDNENMFSFGF